MYSELKQRVFNANLKLPKYGLVTFTWAMCRKLTANAAYWR